MRKQGCALRFAEYFNAVSCDLNALLDVDRNLRLDYTPEYAAKPYDGPRCIASINRLLLDASYPELYEGNPYDWIFLYASQDAYPLDAFRSFMREAYLNKMAPENALH